MSERIGQIIEGTVVLVALYLIVMNSGGFATAIRAIGSTYSGSVTALQGRGGATS